MQNAAIGDTTRMDSGRRRVTKSTNVNLSSVSSDKGQYAALVREAMGGDREAMERLLVRAQEVAYRFSLLVCGHREDAEDVMQDALMKTYRHVKRIRKPDAFRTWLYQTVRNACLMKRRRRVDEPSRILSLDQGIAGDGRDARPNEVDDQARPADRRQVGGRVGGRLGAALAAIAGPDRIIVVLREIEGLSTREVAAVTGISEANVKARLHRARLRLRNQLEGI